MIWFYFMHAFFIILLLCPKNTIVVATSIGNQLVAATTTNGSGGINNKSCCFQKEKQALLDFKASLEDLSGRLSTWRADDDDCCKWRGVTCNNQTHHVTKLDLSGVPGSPIEYLLGEISPSLVNLTQLRYLDLSFNYFNGTIPRSIGSLTQLRYLDLYFNSFNGTIPRSIGSLTQLRYLDLYFNSFNGTIPRSIGSLTQLRYLDLSLNYFNGTIPRSIGSLTQLRYLDLSFNSFNGTIPRSICSLTQLRYLDLSFNYFNGTIPPEFGNLTNLRNLSLGTDNERSCVIESLDWLSNISYLQHLDLYKISLAKANHWIDVIVSLQKLSYLILRRCELSQVVHPYSSFLNSSSPNNIGKSKLEYIYLDISNNKISDTIPVEFWKTWPSRLTYLNLSSNNISGEVPDLSSNFGLYSTIDLSSNSFHGPISNVHPTLVSLNLSKNKFYGGLSFLCQIVDGFLSFLDLSHNSFTGQLPDCLWHFKELKVLNLGDNNLSGRLPASIGYLVRLEVLHLYKNNLSGELPLDLKNCKRLSFLNLGANKFFGNVPVWIGENLTELYAISLRSNNFFGPVPLQLCHLMNLQILDLSINKLNGTIPSCVNNLNAMVGRRLLFGWIAMHSYGMPDYLGFYVDNAMIEWQGKEQEFTNNLGFLTSIDLSSNNLTGQIPNELTDLHELHVLNLSKNTLLGEIPRKIGEMNELLTLDLSRNNFSGVIPASMTGMSLLNYLDVSYNNLSGRIPSSTQLQSFEPSRFTGNAGLCGLPITKNCPGDEVPSNVVVGKHQSFEEGEDEVERWFYIGGCTGFPTGFWIACGALLLNRHGRRVFSHVVDSLKGWVYVKVVVFIRKVQRVQHT